MDFSDAFDLPRYPITVNMNKNTPDDRASHRLCQMLRHYIRRADRENVDPNEGQKFQHRATEVLIDTGGWADIRVVAARMQVSVSYIVSLAKACNVDLGNPRYQIAIQMAPEPFVTQVLTCKAGWDIEDDVRGGEGDDTMFDRPQHVPHYDDAASIMNSLYPTIKDYVAFPVLAPPPPLNIEGFNPEEGGTIGGIHRRGVPPRGRARGRLPARPRAQEGEG